VKVGVPIHEKDSWTVFQDIANIVDVLLQRKIRRKLDGEGRSGIACRRRT